MRGGDSRRFNINIKKDRETILTAAVNLATTESFDFSIFYKAKIKSKSCISLKDYSKNLILRSISSYLAKRHFLVQKNRDRIVKDVIESLCDSTPMYIIRRDISSFYESLPIAKARRFLLNDAFIPNRIRKCLESFFNAFCYGDYGVPRGAGLSAVLAEISMHDFDHQVRNIEGVYKYFRYSDDILIFSYLPTAEISSKIESILPTGLVFNPKKHDDVSVNNKNKDSRHRRYFEYLGYKFSFSDYCGDNKPREVAVSIADRKLSKIKSRIILSLKHFTRDSNFNILLDRLRFIASNYYAYRRGASKIKNSAYVKSGIYYNYHLCGKYTGEKTKPHNCSELKSLDAFYHHLLFSKNSEFSAKILARGAHEISKLKEISFYKGYIKKMTIKFSTTKVHQIKEAWRNV
jgi:hypothetical protein